MCTRYSQAIKDDQAPHLIFDTTISGLASETVKSFSSALGIPTVSASYGQEGDLRQWREIKKTPKNNYLLQVMPPADMIPEVVRSIVTYMNITNAAILYDETFGMWMECVPQTRTYLTSYSCSDGSQVQGPAAEHSHPACDHSDCRRSGSVQANREPTQFGYQQFLCARNDGID